MYEHENAPHVHTVIYKKPKILTSYYSNRVRLFFFGSSRCFSARFEARVGGSCLRIEADVLTVADAEVLWPVERWHEMLISRGA